MLWLTFRSIGSRTGETAHQVRVPIAPSEDLGSFPGTHTVTHICTSSSRGSDALICPLGALLNCHREAYAQSENTYTKQKII